MDKRQGSYQLVQKGLSIKKGRVALKKSVQLVIYMQCLVKYSWDVRERIKGFCVRSLKIYFFNYFC